MNRPSWDTYFFTLAEHAASRATCPRLSVGAVVVRGKRVLSTGYNGAPAGEPHCTHPIDVPCTQAIHAEWNALDAQFGPYDGATMYLTHSPCQSCQRRIIDAGIARVVYRTAYRDPDLTQLERFGITVEHQPKTPDIERFKQALRETRVVHPNWPNWPY
ncbi:deaminase [Amycolatopsis sp. NPDC051373]|uniref:deoxycytidylate deaminase n=1 Tax=Amycolatopsis sp. NPDC051373 TaxID=3155801 RepID=UPI00344DBBDF